MLKKPPKSQKERYETPPLGRIFKGTRHHQEIKRPFGGDTPKQDTAMQPWIKGRGVK